MVDWKRFATSRRRSPGYVDASRAGHDAARIRFFTNIAHELRTPVAVILGQIDAAMLEGNDAARAQQLRVAARNARRIERLADQALELSRLDANALQARVRPVMVVPFVESLVMSFEELAERKGVVLEFFARRGQVIGELDPDHLTTIVSNLLSNALKYTPAGGRVGVAVEFQPPALMRLSVVDTGVGIAPERHDSIFQPFTRGPDDDATHPGGAGIGLALARELARLQGGDVQLESEAGKGARFIVELPLGVDVPHDDQPLLRHDGMRPEVTEEILHRSTMRFQPAALSEAEALPRVVLAEDAADMRDWIAAELAHIAVVQAFGNGGAALEAARSDLPDLVLTDLRLPQLDGIELCRRLRADERTSHIPIVMLSARAEVEARIGAFEAGIDDCLPKPVSGEELRARVLAILERHRVLRDRFREQVVVKPADVSPRAADQVFFEKVLATIESEIGNAEFSVSELADTMAMSNSQLARKLRALIDQSPAQLIRTLRLQRAAALIAAGAGSIAEACYAVGFSDQGHFSRTFKRHFGMAPVDYRREQQEGRREERDD